MSKLIENINKKFYRAYSARTHYYLAKKNWEELYYNDVEGTLSQFTKKQQEAIAATYNIEISTKVAYAIIEQALSLVTASDPFPNLLSADETTEDVTTAYTKAHHGSWYESKASYELVRALRDMFVVGHGLIRVRTNDFFNETTFNTIYEYLDWKSFVCDPEARKPDLSDATYMFITKVMRKERAEKEYEIDLSRYKITNEFSTLQWYDHTDDFYGSLFYKDHEEGDEPVLLKEYFEKVEITVYIGSEGEISLKKPRQTTLPNPEKMALAVEYQSLMEEYSAQVENANTVDEGPAETIDDEDFEQSMQQYQQRESQRDADATTNEELGEQLDRMQRMLEDMPDTVKGYLLTTEKGDVVEAYEVNRIKRKRIRRVLLVGDTIVDDAYLPGENYPIIFFPFMHYNSPNRCFGMMHTIGDMQKALNRLWSMLLNEMQTNGLAKVLYPKGAIVDPHSVESAWALPGAFIAYEPNPSLPDGGKPEVVVPPPMNSTLQYLLQTIITTIEYVTGINALLQGQADPNQQTMGGTQSLQNYGSQRLKLYARQLERPLEMLALVGVTFLQRYAPRDKVLRYFDKDGNVDSVVLMEDSEDLQFKVRVDVGSTIATTRQMAHQLLATIAGQTGNPQVADMLVQHALEIMDLPQGKRWAEEINTIKQLQQQVQELGQQLDEAQKQNKSLENNMQQKTMAAKVDSAVKDTEMDLERLTMKEEAEGGKNLTKGLKQ